MIFDRGSGEKPDGVCQKKGKKLKGVEANITYSLSCLIVYFKESLERNREENV